MGSNPCKDLFATFSLILCRPDELDSVGRQHFPVPVLPTLSNRDIPTLSNLNAVYFYNQSGDEKPYDRSYTLKNLGGGH